MLYFPLKNIQLKMFKMIRIIAEVSEINQQGGLHRFCILYFVSIWLQRKEKKGKKKIKNKKETKTNKQKQTNPVLLLITK